MVVYYNSVCTGPTLCIHAPDEHLGEHEVQNANVVLMLGQRRRH